MNAVFFIIYGLQSLYSKVMKEEFKRFGLSELQRKITGGLQLLGAAGITLGFIAPAIGLLSATGFTLMMFVAFLVRIRIKDGASQSTPSLIFMILNGWLAFRFYNLL